jgi:predicted Fe-Mo cluster-binding NifX family protein
VKLAVATFGERVSPRFDCAQTFLLVTFHEGQYSRRQELSASGWGPGERLERLVALGVEAVVCGGIDLRSAEWLQAAGVKVYARRTGKVEDVLTSLVREDLFSEPEQASRGS